MKTIRNSHSVCINYILWEHIHEHLLTHVHACFHTTRQSEIIEAESLWPRKPKIFTLWSFIGSLSRHDLTHYFPNQKVHSYQLFVLQFQTFLFFPLVLKFCKLLTL